MKTQHEKDCEEGERRRGPSGACAFAAGAAYARKQVATRLKQIGDEMEEIDSDGTQADAMAYVCDSIIDLITELEAK